MGKERSQYKSSGIPKPMQNAFEALPTEYQSFFNRCLKDVCVPDSRKIQEFILGYHAGLSTTELFHHFMPGTGANQHCSGKVDGNAKEGRHRSKNSSRRRF